MNSLQECLDSLQAQTLKPHIVVVENGSTDGSLEFVQSRYPEVEVVIHQKNQGFAGGVNAGIRRTLEAQAEFVALLNNDAVADKEWLESLVTEMHHSTDIGIVTSKILDMEQARLDSTGDFYTTWGLPYPRGRGEPVSDRYDHDLEIFAASGGASLYRTQLFADIGLFDENFFAYYEDVDLSFRAQLAGWKVRYAPGAIVLHHIGATSSKIKGFHTYQTMKNLPMLFWKNVPLGLMPTILPRFTLVYGSFFISAAGRHQLRYALKGAGYSLLFLPKKLAQRWHIQHTRKVPTSYIKSLLYYDLPPNADRLRTLRTRWWKLRGKTA